jgi:serine/threonine-protein kinase
MASSPARIGKYEILAELGRGGFAVVYQARDVELDRLVALKVLRPALSDDAEFVARFRQEARAVARLQHRNIITVHDAAQIDGQLIIAMQYLSGRTLRDELKSAGVPPLKQTLAILEQVAAALDFAHQQGVVHRDVKPANIMLEDTDQGVHATLLDFGLAKALEVSTALTSQGTLLGSPEYMAPEQADPNRVNEIGPATDRYALGIVAYQLLTGRVPFPGNIPATLNAHLHLTPPDPRTLRSEVSPQVSVVLLKMLAKAPADRYASAGQFVRALRSAATPSAHPIPAKPVRWLRWALVGAAVVLVIGIAGYVVGTQLVQPAATPQTTPPGALPALTPTVTLAPASVLTAGSVQTRTSDGMAMVFVPGGTFRMGSDSGNDDEKPVHDVTLDGFWIDRTEVTNAQYARCVAAQQCTSPTDTNSYTRPYFGNPQFDDYPVIHVTWENANQYCTSIGGQLPTEAQWEYAARGPAGNVYPWGNAPPDDRWLNYRGAIGDTQPVGAYLGGASWAGALDLAGNVAEWVNDWYGPYVASAQTNPAGPVAGSYRVLRGGSWSDYEDNVRAAARIDNAHDDRGVLIGFRCVVSPRE